MLQNLFTVAFRSFVRNRFISLIHVLGLSVGISAALVIYLIVRFESNFDKFQQGGDRIYRVVMDLNMNGMEGHSAAVPAPLANAMWAEVSGIEQVVPVMTFQGDGKVTVALSSNPEKVFKNQEGVAFTNRNYFELMPFAWVIGSPEVSMKNPFSVVLTESRARLYFPDTPFANIVGQSLIYNGEVTASVTGIVSDLHQSTDLRTTEFITYATISKTVLKDNFMMDNWNDWMAYSSLYVKLSAANDRDGVNKQINSLASRFSKADKDHVLTYVLQPLPDIHFNAQYNGFNMRIASKATLQGLMWLAAFLLLLACINFTNLASAQTSLRAREIGVRKSIGSSRRQLIVQFLTETFCVTLIAAVLSIVLAPAILDLFADFIPQGVVFSPSSQPGLLLFTLLLCIVVTMVAGIYPAWILSGLRPALVLKGNTLPLGSGSASLRKVLTVSQFMIAQVIIFGAFMVSKQVRYSLYEDLGYRKDAIVYFDVPRDGTDHREALLNEVRKTAGVSMATMGFLPPAIEGGAFGDITYVKDGVEIKEQVQVRWGEPEYIEVYGIDLVAGRNIRRERDVAEVLINEQYARAIGFKDPAEALGQNLLNRNMPYTIVGVMRDFHESSMRAPIGPIIFFTSDRSFFFHVALSPERQQWQQTLEDLRRVYTNLYPASEFKYTFFDESIAEFYKAEQNTSRLLNWAMAISMLISCMGLLGLVMHTSETRTKEVGIRKVLGASVTHLVSLLSFDFIKLVAIAFALAVPISWWATTVWLKEFAYKTPINWWVFALSGATMIAVALLAVGFHTFKSANANPVRSLRTE